MASSSTPKGTSCLLIGAAPSPRVFENGRQVFREDHQRMFQSVQKDLSTMMNFCAKWGKKPTPTTRRQSRGTNLRTAPAWRSPVQFKLLLNDKALNPCDSIYPLEEEALMMLDSGPAPLIYKNKEEVREQVREFITACPVENIIIFYSGHGSLEAEVHNRLTSIDLKIAPETIPLSPARVQHSLTIPTSVNSKESYTDSQLTNDVAGALQETPRKHLYLVVHACNSGGMVQDDEFTVAQRLSGTRLSLNVALFASSEAENTSDWTSTVTKDDYVTSFTKSAKPGRTLSEIQGDLFDLSLPANPNRSPVLVTIRPELANECLL